MALLLLLVHGLAVIGAVGVVCPVEGAAAEGRRGGEGQGQRGGRGRDEAGAGRGLAARREGHAGRGQAAACGRQGGGAARVPLTMLLMLSSAHPLAIRASCARDALLRVQSQGGSSPWAQAPLSHGALRALAPCPSASGRGQGPRSEPVRKGPEACAGCDELFKVQVWLLPEIVSSPPSKGPGF